MQTDPWLDPSTRKHLLAVARCPLMVETLEGAATPCSTIVDFQVLRSDEFQVPTPWLGRLDQAPLLFIGANPSIGFTEDYPTYPADDEVELVDAFHFAFESDRQWIRDGNKQLRADGTHTRTVAFWSHVKGRARELLGREPRPGVDYAITEIVRCRSRTETGVGEALDECSGRWLATTLGLSSASVIMVFGKNARTAMRTRFDLKAGKLVGPLTLAGRTRQIVFLPHPNARGDKTITKVLGVKGLSELRRSLDLAR